MHNYKNLLASIIAFCTLFFCLQSGYTFAQRVTNGSFESSNTGIVQGTDIKGWLIQVVDGLTPPPVFEIVSDNVKQGNRALKVTVGGVGTNQWDIQLVADSIPDIPDIAYNYTIWAKAEKPGAQVNFTVGNYSFSEYGAIRPANLTTEWQKFTMRFTVNDNQTVIRAPIHFSIAANTGNVIYIDNLQIYDDNFGKTPVTIEAESGKAGSNFSLLQQDSITYVTTKTNFTGLASPGDSSRIIIYQVTFQDSGYYNLFARIRVGSGAYDDDSFFAGRGFGVKNDTSGTDWIFINGLAAAGFSAPADVVNDKGTAGSQIWKWVNITKSFFPATSPEDSFYVNIDSLTKTFQIGSREDGLDIDKFAFGKSTLYFSVKDLDYELPGSPTIKGVDSSNFYQGPPLAEGLPKFLGNVMADDNIFANYWNQITPGNEGKWGSVAGSSDTSRWSWGGLDVIYNYAKKHNLIFKDHTLIWGQQQPSWISALDSAQQAYYIETWISKVGERYPGIDMIDVVNEPLAGHNPPDGGNSRANYKNALGGNGETGWDWVINSFKLARKYLPNSKLLLNDYGIINDNAATTTYLKIINLLKDRGLIDGIGVQGHRFELENANVTTLKSNLDRLAVTDLPVYISEMDLGNLNDSGTPNDDQQLQLYQKIFPVLWQHPGVKGITLWGYIEGQMWQPTCYLVHPDGTWRPALTWLAQYIKDNPTEIKQTAEALPTDYKLGQNYPNPFNPTTNISYSIVNTTEVTLKVYDVLGREIRILVSSVQAPGNYTITFDARDLTSGVYFYTLNAGNFNTTKKLLLLK